MSKAAAAVKTTEQHESEERRLYSLIEIKQADDDLRILRGTATTPQPDRMGDIVEPLGVSFKNPVPLLWQHNSREPVGHAKLGKPTEDGISFEARIPKISEPGKLKDRLDEAWQSLKTGLVRGVSIGFKANELSFLKDGGIHFLATEVLELSLVTIPANSQATIDELKAFDLKQRNPNPMLPEVGQLAGGATQPRRFEPVTPTKVKAVTKPMTVGEQIAAFEAKRAANCARMTELMNSAADGQQTLGEAESTEYDDLADSVKKVDQHLVRLRDLENANKAAAVAVGGTSLQIGNQARDVRNPVISVKANAPGWVPFIRYCRAIAAGNGNRWEAMQFAKQWQADMPEIAQWVEADISGMMQKAAVGAGTTTDATWATPLIAYQIAADQFAELLRPLTIIGRLQGLRRVPFNIQLPRATAGTSMSWVGENAPKPVTNMAFDTVQLRWAKAAGIILLTQELVRFSNPAADDIVRQDMLAAMTQFLDRQFVDPTVAAVLNVSPASITNGAATVSRSGTNQAAFVTDATALLTTFLTANLSTAGGTWIMSQRQALAFSLMLNALGQPFYPNITAEGGTLLGYPVVASENVPSVGNSPADGTPIIFCIPREIMLADDGQTVIDASNQASVQMESAPDSPPTAATNMVSLWQMNFVGLRAERWINWLKRRSTACTYIPNANYA